MQVRLTVVDLDGDRRPRNYAVDASAGATAATLQPLLTEVTGGRCSAQMYVDGSALSPEAPLGQPPLVDGSVLTLGGPGMVAPRRIPGLLELHVVAGPDSGQVYRLPPGRRQVGRATEAAIRLDDPDVSRVHAGLDVRDDGVHVTDLGSSNGSTVAGVSLREGPALLPVGGQLVVGTSTLVLRVPAGTPAALSPGGDGQLAVNRSPRIAAPMERPEFRLPEPPQRREPLRMPILASLLPLLLALVLAKVTHNATMLLFGLMSPVMLAGSYLSDRRAGRAGNAAARAAYRFAMERTSAAIAAALVREAGRRHQELPDRAELLLSVEGPTARLWERRRRDEDRLVLRVGTGRLNSRVIVLDPLGGSSSPDVADVPVPLRLAELGVVGVSGPREQSLGLMRGLIADICGWHSPVDVSLVVLAASEPAGDDWTWTAHLPHTRPRRGEQCRNLVGIGWDHPQLLRRVAELSSLVDQRSTHLAGLGTRRWDGPCTVVLLDGAQRLRTVPGLAQLLATGPGVGIYFLCMDDAAAQLPVETQGAVHLGSPTPAESTLQVTGEPPVHAMTADRVSARWAERFARALAPLRDATPSGENGGLPDSARLLDILDADRSDPTSLADRWQRQPRSTRAVLGVSAAGAYAVDLARDGPHVLVGGTTGAGKSELLQTLIASLAIANRPDQLSFVLVDYKGGAAFRECAQLPHTVGLVTDLDPHLTERALTSLTAELQRRERLLQAGGAKDLDEYQVRAGPGDPVIPRLVLVIDEFRMLAEELPAFLGGMVRIAALGRSLGVHLVLATQRPAGIVSADIKANVNLRIALRVRDSNDSQDVVDALDTASISERTPGRAVARSGSNPLTAFQTARVGGPPPPPPTAGEQLSWQRLTWQRLGDPYEAGAAAERDGPDGTASTTTGPSDLSQIVRSCRGAAELAGVASTPSPWLAPLPDLVTAHELEPDRQDPWQIPLGRVDLPAQQAQPVLGWDLERGGHLAVAGMARTGRTTLLRSVAGALAGRLPASAVHVYVLDGGSGAMACLTALPHTGAVVPRSDPERLDRLIRRLGQEVQSRQEQLGRLGHSSLAEQRAHAASTGTQPLPYLVLLVDGWDGVMHALEDVDHGRPVDAMLRLLRDGVSVGLRAMVAGDRSVLLSRVTAVIPDTLVLQMSDPTDLVLAGIPPRQVPAHMPPGRALRVSDAAEVQLAVLTAELSGPAQVTALVDAGAEAWRLQSQSAARPTPFKVERLPTHLRVGQLRATPPAGASAWALVGAGGDDLTALGIDLSAPGSAALVAGPPGSGRTTTLSTMAMSLAAYGTPVALAATSRSWLPDISGRPGVLGVLAPEEGERLREWAGSTTGLVVLVDDADQMLDAPLEQVLVELLRRVDGPRVSIVCSGASGDLSAMFRGLTVEARKQRVGVLLNPSSFSDGDLFGLRLAHRHNPGDALPGRGLLIARGAVLPVQVAQTT